VSVNHFRRKPGSWQVPLRIFLGGTDVAYLVAETRKAARVLQG